MICQFGLGQFKVELRIFIGSINAQGTLIIEHGFAIVVHSEIAVTQIVVDI